MPCTSDRPRPVPTPTSLVVKNGSKIRASTRRRDAAAVVGDVQAQVAAGGSVLVATASGASSSTASSATSSLPSARIACTAFAHRFITTWWICVGSPSTPASPAASLRLEPHAGRSDAATASSASSTTDCTCTGTRSPMPLREKARMRSTSDFARWPAAIAASMWRRCSVPSGRALLRQLAVAEDGRQDVVEVVRDAAGERADRLELLRLAQLLFEPLALGSRRACARRCRR